MGKDDLNLHEAAGLFLALYQIQTPNYLKLSAVGYIEQTLARTVHNVAKTQENALIEFLVQYRNTKLKRTLVPFSRLTKDFVDRVKKERNTRASCIHPSAGKTYCDMTIVDLPLLDKMEISLLCILLIRFNLIFYHNKKIIWQSLNSR
jgi:hypothetical protein